MLQIKRIIDHRLAGKSKNCTYKHETIIHHSDRGIKYCCPDYTQYTENKGFVLSTTQQYDPYEKRSVAPCITERINGILKFEFDLKNTLKSVELAKKITAQAVDLYKNDRMHLSLRFRKPNEVHKDYNKYENKNYKKDQKNKVKSKIKS